MPEQVVDVMETLGTVATFMWTQVTSVVTNVAAQPLLLIPVGIFVVGGGIGLAKRLIGR